MRRSTPDPLTYENATECFAIRRVPLPLRLVARAMSLNLPQAAPPRTDVVTRPCMLRCARSELAISLNRWMLRQSSVGRQDDLDSAAHRCRSGSKNWTKASSPWRVVAHTKGLSVTAAVLLRSCGNDHLGALVVSSDHARLSTLKHDPAMGVFQPSGLPGSAVDGARTNICSWRAPQGTQHALSDRQDMRGAPHPCAPCTLPTRTQHQAIPDQKPRCQKPGRSSTTSTGTSQNIGRRCWTGAPLRRADRWWSRRRDRSDMKAQVARSPPI